MPKHIPLRTCVACRQSRAKRSLIRVVRGPDGAVAADPTGKRPGRGAYLCAVQPCWEAALKKRLLEHTFKTAVSDTDRAALEAFARTLPATADEAAAPSGPPAPRPVPRIVTVKSTPRDA